MIFLHHLLAGHGQGPHSLEGGDVAAGPKPGMGIFAMMATIGTLPSAVPSNINGRDAALFMIVIVWCSAVAFH